MEVKSEQESDNKSVLEIARERFKLALDAESEFRKIADEDTAFRAGDQWPEGIKRQRQLEQRPCLTINKIPQSIRQVTNDQRQNKPSIKVNPVDDAADVDTAKILQGMIRHIEYNSNADVAYDRAFEKAVERGLGYYRIVTEYSSPESFDQEILIKSIANPKSVVMDPFYKEPDASDANYGFITDDLGLDDFKSQYPNAKACNKDNWKDVGDNFEGWFDNNTVRVCEYFYKSYKTVTLALLSDGTVVNAADLEGLMPEGLEVVRTRDAVLPAIKWLKITGIDILEETDWLGSWIPIIPVPGDEILSNGKRIFEGIVRHAKDPQRMYNYWATAETETIALSSKAPWIGYEGQFEGHEGKWNTANTVNHAYLEVKGTTIGGQPAPLPQRNVSEPPIMAITQARRESSEDIKATTGIYDASLGNRSNESSGIAIQRRSNQAQVSNFHYIDNLSRSIRHGGRIIVELIPRIYDTAKAIRILGEDGAIEMVKINETFMEKGQAKIHNLSAGKYDVAVETGPSYQTKRQEAVLAMLDFTKAMPQQAANVADLIAKNMDWPGATEFAERFKKMLPPGLVEQKEGEQAPIPPEVKQQMDQMGKMLDQMTEQLNDANNKIENKTLELESKERIEMAKLETQATIELAKLESKEALTMLSSQISELDRRTKQLGFNEPFPDEPEDEFQQQNLNGAGGTPAMATGQEQQLTGELPPG